MTDWVFLDLDGTLTDAGPGITRSIAYALEKLDLPVPAQATLESMIGPALQETFPKVGVPTADVDRALRFYRERYTDVGLFENRVYDGALDMMADLRDAGYRLAMATAKPIAYATRITEHFGLAPLMDMQFGSELNGHRTDKRDLLEHVLTETGGAAARCFMLGDRKHDAIGAIHNGVTPLGAAWGFGAMAELEAAGCAAIAAAPVDVPAIVEELR